MERIRKGIHHLNLMLANSLPGEIVRQWWETQDQHLVRQCLWSLIIGTGVFIWAWSILLALVMGYDHVGNPLYVFKALVLGLDAPYMETGGILAVAFLVLAAVLFQNWVQMGVHGRARWANKLDIKRAGLDAEQGLLLGKYWGRYLCADLYHEDGHLQILSPSGSGKGAAFVIPNLLNWNHSAVVLDIKGECHHYTSGFRAHHGQQVYLWNPAADDGQTACYNPFDMVSREPLKRIGDLKDLANILWPADSDKGEIWQPGARSVFVAVALELMDNGNVDLTFGNVLRKIKLTPDFAEFVNGLLERHFDKENDYALDVLALQNFTSFLQQASKEQSGLLSTIKSGLELWEDPVIDAATSRSDFDFRELRAKRISIYVGIPLGRLIRLSRLLNIFFQQCITVLSEHEPDAKEPYRVLMVLDEFPLLGKMDVFKKGIGFLRSFGVRMMMIAQSKAQVADIYGGTIANQIFSQNCRFVVAYAPNDDVECKEIAEKLGKRTVRTSSKTYSNNRPTTNISFTGKDLLSPEEVRRFTKHKEIIFPQNNRPVKAYKIVYYTDQRFKQRLLPPAPVPRIDIRAHHQRNEQAYLDQFKRKRDGEEGSPGSREPAQLDNLSQAQKEALVDQFDELFTAESE